MMQVKFFNPGKEFKLHEKEYTKVWKDVRRRGQLILRDEVEAFEKAFAKYNGVKYAVGLNSGTDALLVALKAIGIGKGDKVLVPSHTFVATAQVVAQLGAKPVLYDFDALLDSTGVKAIMVAHISGLIDPNTQGLVNWAKSRSIPVIEDACQSLGAIQNGKKAGSLGVAGCFSFYPAKILGGPGDGGALITNDKKVYDFAIEYRNHWKKDYSQWGINSRLDNVIAAELLVKLKRLPKTLERRREIANKYISGLPAHLSLVHTRGRVWQDFIIRTEVRDRLYDFLKKEGIETMKNEYPFPIKKGPLSIKYESETLRLPINEVLTDGEVNYVIKKINQFYDMDSL